VFQFSIASGSIFAGLAGGIFLRWPADKIDCPQVCIFVAIGDSADRNSGIQLRPTFDRGLRQTLNRNLKHARSRNREDSETR
jgi:hypothetical protein